MRILIDNINNSIQNAGGISALWYELSIRSLNDPELEISFLDVPNNNIFRSMLDIPIENIVENPLRHMPLKLQRYLNPYRLSGKGIFHSSYYRITDNKNFVNITTVHDFVHEYYRKGLARFVNSKQKKRAIFNADKIICVSQNTKKDLLNFYPQILEDDIHVIYNGVSDSYFPIGGNTDDQLRSLIPYSKNEFVLFVGYRQKEYKNFIVAVNACKKAKIPLVIVGGGKITSDEAKILLSHETHCSFVHLSNVSNSNLNILYNNALCLLYPSLYEGFGIPLIEAQKAGCPVICSKNSSIPEVVHESALFVEDNRIETYADHLNFLKNDISQMSLLIEKGFLNARRFSWDKCYQQTKEVYKEAYKKLENK